MVTLLDSGEDAERIAIAVYLHLTRYGWTSTKALHNTLQIEDPRVVGGVLSGLQRGGLIVRGMGTPATMAALIVEPHPVFVPGPEFPSVDSESPTPQ